MVKVPRNKFEYDAKRRLDSLVQNFEYEAIKLPYILECEYTPDFIDRNRKIIVETKGEFDGNDRRKMKVIKATYPDWKILMVLQAPHMKISKGAKMTYSQWCDKEKIQWTTIDNMNSILSGM